MGLLDNITPQQRQMALIGAGGVAVLALFNRSKAPAASSSAPSQPLYYAAPNTDAIDTGQLSTFEDAIAGQLQDLSQNISDLENAYSNPTNTAEPVNTSHVMETSPGVGETAMAMAARLNAEGKRMTMGNRVGDPIFAEYLLFVNGLGDRYQNTTPLPAGRLLQF